MTDDSESRSTVTSMLTDGEIDAIAGVARIIAAERTARIAAEERVTALTVALLDIWDIASPASFEEADDIAEVLIKHGLAERRKVDPSKNEWDADELTFLLPPLATLTPSPGEPT